MSAEFASKLKAWRGDLTQREAAQLLGVPVRTLERWEFGETEPHVSPSMAEIEKRMAETSKVVPRGTLPLT